MKNAEGNSETFSSRIPPQMLAEKTSEITLDDLTRTLLETL